MSISPINSASSANFTAMMAYGSGSSSEVKTPVRPSDSGRDPAAVKKAAAQFEAIILRQLLAPSMASIMSGGSSESSEGGGGIYGYMLTDTFAGSLAQGGGLGLARMLEKQLTPRGPATDIKENGPAVASSSQLYTFKKS